jgi:eukaryotic-like serine/threonine-protein kinase
MLMMYVPEGGFLMGSDPAKDENAQYDEQPQHSVYLDAYWIDQTEVTNGMYAKCVSAGKCFLPQDSRSALRHNYYGNSKYADYPVIYVDWNQAKTYCAWAGADLPTEAQWEKASRGTDGRLYPWGDASPSSNLLNYGNVGDTTEVGHYPDGVSPYGALDMSGNVWEWVNDWYGIENYPSSPERNPQGAASGIGRIFRGAAYYLIDGGARSADRSGMEPTYRDSGTGFRCARSAASL